MSRDKGAFMEKIKTIFGDFTRFEMIEKICEKTGFKVSDFESYSNEDLAEAYANYVENYYIF